MPTQTDVSHNWPGWSLEENPFGSEFDQAARERMIQGSKLLLPFILKHREKLDGRLCEIGPFFNPLLNYSEITPHLSENTEIIFIENDRFAINFLRENINCKIWEIDLNQIPSPENFSNSPGEMAEQDNLFDLIIISQVLNYVDFKNLFRYLHRILTPNGVILINNSIDYGLPTLFSELRPRKNEDLIDSAIGADFNVIEKSILPKSNDHEQHNRLILILSK